MKKNTLIRTLAAAAVACLLAMGLAACGSSDTASENTENTEPVSTTEDIVAKAEMEMEEYEGDDSEPTPEMISKATEMNKQEDSFYGTWKAESEQAEYLYGNLEITISKDGSFKGNVTGEDFSGKWTKQDTGIEFKSDILSGRLFFGQKCQMIIYDEYETPVTLTKQ